MCGICGAIDFRERTVRPETLRDMCRVLTHRGPDDGGGVFFRDGQTLKVGETFEPALGQRGFEAALGHRRLSIIDLTPTGQQPMANEDGTAWIVFNGEIYNFQVLREELLKKGHQFKSTSDTEVILHAYETWDVKCLDAFRGMFAFAIWDVRRRRLFLARDRLGKKPLVYFHQGGQFVFASEMKAVLQVLDVPREVNPSALSHYLTYQYVPSPETIFAGIKKLPPAHYLLYDSSGHVTLERYWTLRFGSGHEKPLEVPEWCELIRKEFEASVRLRLISDVPLGAFLSGGIDSSLVVGMMARLTPAPVKTFSIGFEEEGFDELAYARRVSKHFATDHHEFVVQPKAVEVLPKLVWHYGEPFADASAIPTYYVAKMTKDYVKVVLTGDGGDESFAGYKRYVWSQWVALFTRLPGTIRARLLPSLLRKASSLHWREPFLNRLADFMEALTNDQGRNYLEQVKIFNRKEARAIYTEGFAESLNQMDPYDILLEKFHASGTDPFIDQLLSVDINTYLPDDLLVKVDIATMAHSLEARVPFLDHRLMEVAARIPSQLKLKGAGTKLILKRAFADFLPETILNRKKMGFAVPLSRWFRNELREYVYGVLLDEKALSRGYFRREGIERLLDDHVALRYDHSTRIWALLMLELWFKVFVDRQERGIVHEP